MTHSRLEELISNPDITNQELAEILGATLLSVSKHAKEIKITLNPIDTKLEVIKKNLYILEEKSNFGFGIIMDDEED
jgi:hypothetical protein